MTGRKGELTWLAAAVSAVGERALAAVRGDGCEAVYYSQWGGRRVATVLAVPAAERVALLDDTDWRYRARYEPAAFTDAIDYLTIEAVYHVSAGAVAVYRPVWLGISHPTGEGSTVDPTGLLVRVATPAEYRRLRAFTRVLKDLLVEACRLEILTSQQASELLVLALRVFCTPERIHTPGRALVPR